MQRALRCVFVEVAPDYKSEGDYALDVGDAAGVADHMRYVEERAALWLPGSDNCGRPSKVARRKLQRVKTHRVLLELDNALQGHDGSGAGLARFQRPLRPDGTLDLSSPLQWPRLVLASDQGPDIWSAATWLEGPGRANVHRVSDPNHGVHADTLLSAFDCKLGTYMYVLAVLVNLSFLPWLNGKYGQMMRQAMQEHKRLWSHRSSPFFQSLWFQIAKDKGMEFEVHEESGMERLWDALHNSRIFTNMGSKVGMARFYQLFVELKLFIQDWNSCLVWVILVGSSSDCAGSTASF